MSSSIDTLYADFPAEHASTRRMLQRYPDGRGDWRPHEKSRPIGALATHVADIVNRGTSVLETDFLTVGRTPMAPIDSAKGLVDFFDTSVARFTAALAGATPEMLEVLWSVRAGDRTIFEQPRKTMLRTVMMNHLIHHRAQLGVYYRLLDIKVPGTYGPSADEPV